MAFLNFVFRATEMSVPAIAVYLPEVNPKSFRRRKHVDGEEHVAPASQAGHYAGLN